MKRSWAGFVLLLVLRRRANALPKELIEETTLSLAEETINNEEDVNNGNEN